MKTSDGDARALLPEGESMERAVRWSSERRRSEPGLSVLQIANDAALRFDLTPLQSQYLLKLLTGGEP